LAGAIAPAHYQNIYSRPDENATVALRLFWRAAYTVDLAKESSRLGLGSGAEIDQMSVIISRYFGIRFFGALHAVLVAPLPLGFALSRHLGGG
jgi:hypothetical protein